MRVSTDPLLLAYKIGYYFNEIIIIIIIAIIERFVIHFQKEIYGESSIYLLLYIQQLRIYSGQLSIEYSIAQSIYLDTFTTNKKKENLFLLYIFWFEVFNKKRGDIKYPKEFYKVQTSIDICQIIIFLFVSIFILLFEPKSAGLYYIERLISEMLVGGKCSTITWYSLINIVLHLIFYLQAWESPQAQNDSIKGRLPFGCWWRYFTVLSRTRPVGRKTRQRHGL